MIDNEQLQYHPPHHITIDGSIESSAKRIERLNLSTTIASSNTTSSSSSPSTSTSSNRIEPLHSQFSDGFAINIGKKHCNNC